MYLEFFMSMRWTLFVCSWCFMLTACLTEDDTPPEIEEGTFQIFLYDEVQETFSNVLEDGELIEVPGSFVVAGNIRDDVLIEKIEMNIYPQDNFEEDPTKRVSIFPWDASGDDVIELPVQGNAVNVFREVQLPNSAQSGNYILDVTVFDEKGNASETYIKSFTISNESPLVTLTQPIADNETYIEGDTLKVRGQVEAINDLQTVSLRLGAGDNFLTISYSETDFTSKVFNIDTGFVITDTLGIGDRNLRVNAIDILDKTSRIELPVTIEGI